MDIRIATCVFGRPEITRAFLHHLNYLREESGLKLPVSIAYSTQEDLAVLREFCTKDDHLIRIDNKPIGRKWNELFKAIIRDTKQTHILGVGSDDFLNVDYLKYLSENECHHCGVNRFLIYSPMHKRLVEHEFKSPVFKLTGGGRLLSYEAVRKVFERCNLYATDLNAGLDNNSEMALRNVGFAPTVIDFDGYAFVDVKSMDNIHKFEEFANNSDVDFEVLEQIMPNVSF